MRIKSVNEARIKKNSKILVRVDFNVPVKNGIVLDDFKIRQQLKTIRFLIKNRAKVVLLTHLGRPQPGKMDKKFSSRPLADKLEELLGYKVAYVDDIIGLRAETALVKLKEGEILMLENIRYEEGEEKNSKSFAYKLSKLCDIYVNEAFAVSHRKHASVAAVKELMPAYAGFLLKEEIVNLNKALDPSQPLVILMGGAKIATKAKVIKRLAPKSDHVLIGGALANAFLKARGYKVGRSLIDKAGVEFAKTYKRDNVLLPEDLVLGSKNSRWQGRIAKTGDIMSDEYIFDIGPKTIKLYSHFLKKAKTIIWNGPMGMFEDSRFKHGTMAMAQVIASRSSGRAFGIVGGGETVEALNLSKMAKYVDWVSTGGGAMLSYLGGEPMPGLKGLITD